MHGGGNALGHILKLAKLSENELLNIRSLENDCCSHERLNMKMNWDMLKSRNSIETNDFLYFEEDNLVGFLGMYSFGREEIEITGMVHPAFRRRGIFRQLLGQAKAECIDRGIKKILVISERSSEAGRCFLNSIGATYDFSEHRMEFKGNTVPDYLGHGITLVKPKADYIKQFLKMDADAFGTTLEEIAGGTYEKAYESTYGAVLEDKLIGKIGLVGGGTSRYIFGFVIKPEYRRKGYGREVLSSALILALFENAEAVLLEVSVSNENALNLYKSCGFNIMTVYDYYKIATI